LSVRWQEEAGIVTSLTLHQTAPDDHPHLRPHALAVAVIDQAGELHSVEAACEDDVDTRIEGAAGLPAPAFAYPNHGDHAYAKISLDPRSTGWARSNLGSIPEPLLRQQVWVSLWEMVRDRELSSLDYLDTVRASLPAERSLPIVQMVTATAAGAVGRYVPEHRIDGEAAAFVAAARDAIREAPPGDLRVLWARALTGLALTAEEAHIATELIDSPPDGLAVDQDMRWSVAIRGVELGLEGAEQRLQAERERDPSDRGDRAMAQAEAVRPDPAVKQDVWDRLHHSGYASLRLALAAAGGFWRRSQRELLEPFVPRFFEGLPGLFSSWEQEAAKNYFQTFVPAYRVEDATVESIDAALSHDDIGPMLRRLLVEAKDDLERALACRVLAAAGV
jgi:aminopeptidase N